jgi:hypothetical protein
MDLTRLRRYHCQFFHNVPGAIELDPLEWNIAGIKKIADGISFGLAAYGAALVQAVLTLLRRMENVNALKRISIPNAASYTSFKNVQTLRGCGLVDVQRWQQ